MKGRVLTSCDLELWGELLKRIPLDQHEPHFLPSYNLLFEKQGQGTATCFIHQEGDDIAMYPYLVKSINDLGYDLPKRYYDIQGAYGYNGFLTNNHQPDFLDKAGKAFCNYCCESNIVAEFIRFNPITGNHRFHTYLTPLKILDNVLIDLTPDLEKIWSDSFDKGVRKAIRYGLNHNLRAEILTGPNITQRNIADFQRIYHSTMARNEADEFYFFNETFFQEVFDNLPDNVVLAFTYHENNPISTEMILHGARNAYGFLGGTLREYYSMSPNSFLRYEIIKALKEKGIRNYSIGGGQQPSDSIYKFKKSFARNTQSDFYIGKVIHDQEVYALIAEQWKLRYPESYSSFRNRVLGYREIKSHSHA